MNLEQLKKDAVEEYHVGLRKKEDVGESTTNKRELAKRDNIHRHIERQRRSTMVEEDDTRTGGQAASAAQPDLAVVMTMMQNMVRRFERQDASKSY
ncbi:unnamed protein product [Brassica napus]|uniref:(rape) hypothetical protein n=1 Tax=Brassica napus TaxID=3708 RepID=A0A816U7E4_BRANA|nr:unnamed protein product [Brassica napus]